MGESIWRVHEAQRVPAAFGGLYAVSRGVGRVSDEGKSAISALSWSDVLADQVDISNCDREPIHIPGLTQSHGCVIVCDATLESVRRRSANAPALLGIDPGRFDNAVFADLVGERFAHSLRNALSKARDPRRPGLLFGRELPGTQATFDVSVHAHGNNAIVEFEPAAAKESSALDIARSLISRTQSRARLPDLLAIAPRLVRAVLGYDRVMIYRFAVDGSGKVIAEDRRGDLESFSGQHFPAGDIPAQARALYQRQHHPHHQGYARRWRRAGAGGARARRRRPIFPMRICARYRRSIWNICATWASPPPCRCRSWSMANSGA